MKSMLQNIRDWLRDPPPATLLEISESGVSMARLGPKGGRLPEHMAFAPLPPGAVDSSPVRENVHNVEELDRALQQVLQQAGPLRKKKDAALFLPDNCARLSVLDFENLPGDGKERLSLIRWRLKKAVPFDVDTASIAYQIQRGRTANQPFSVLVAVSPAEIIGQYEAAVKRLDLNPGYVSISIAAALNLVVEQGVTMLAKLSGHILSLVVIDQGQVRLVRSLEIGASDPLPEEKLRETAADLYPTFVYVADNFGAPVTRLLLAGFGGSLQTAADVFRRELGYESAPLTGPQGMVDSHSAGIWGFLSTN